MQTTKLSTLQRPSRVQVLLESLLQERQLLPEHVRRIQDRSELSSRLQRIAMETRNTERVWSAWTDGGRIWFFTAEMSLPLSHEQGQATLQVGLYREDGKMRSWDVWVNLSDGTWQPCAP